MSTLCMGDLIEERNQETPQQKTRRGPRTFFSQVRWRTATLAENRPYSSDKKPQRKALNFVAHQIRCARNFRMQNLSKTSSTKRGEKASGHSEMSYLREGKTNKEAESKRQCYYEGFTVPRKPPKVDKDGGSVYRRNP